MKHLLTLAMVTSTCCAAWNVSAQDKDSSYRKGPLAGFAFGGGAANCNGCAAQGGPAYDWHIGWSVSGKVALMLDRVMIVVDDYRVYRYDLTESFTIDTVAAQYWPTDRVWVRGGVGLATYRMTCHAGACSAFRTSNDKGLGMTAAAGVELVRTRKRGFAMDLQAHFQAAERIRFNTAAALRVGFNWYRRRQRHAEGDAGQRPTDGGPS